jgi:hypothetical protein
MGVQIGEGLARSLCMCVRALVSVGVHRLIYIKHSLHGVVLTCLKANFVWYHITL